MKVKEVIEQLLELPQEASIFIDLGDDLEAPWRYSIEEAKIGFVVRKVNLDGTKVLSRPCRETGQYIQGVIIYVSK